MAPLDPATLTEAVQSAKFQYIISPSHALFLQKHNRCMILKDM
jgi:hypothetical protein